MGQLSGQSGAGLEEPGARGSTVWGAKLGSDEAPRRWRRVKGRSRATAWRVILQASLVTLPSERAMNRVLAIYALSFALPCAESSRTEFRYVPSFFHPQGLRMALCSRTYS